MNTETERRRIACERIRLTTMDGHPNPEGLMEWAESAPLDQVEVMAFGAPGGGGVGSTTKPTMGGGSGGESPHGAHTPDFYEKQAERRDYVAQAVTARLETLERERDYWKDRAEKWKACAEKFAIAIQQKSDAQHEYDFLKEEDP